MKVQKKWAHPCEYHFDKTENGKIGDDSPVLDRNSIKELNFLNVIYQRNYCLDKDSPVLI